MSLICLRNLRISSMILVRSQHKLSHVKDSVTNLSVNEVFDAELMAASGVLVCADHG